MSVIIPCYNDGAYLSETMASVFHQTYHQLIEVIIVDDGSTDERTKELLENARWPTTTIIHSENKGPAAARNIGIHAARGKYILPLDADDKIHPTYIEKAVAVLESQPNVGIVYCQADYFGGKKGRWSLPPYSLERMLLDNVIFTTALFRKTDWETVGGLNESLVHGMEDYDFWLSIIEMGREVVQIPEVLFYYRIRETSRTRRFMSSRENIYSTYQTIYRNHPRLYLLHQELYVTVLRNALIDQSYWLQTYQKLIENRFIKLGVKTFFAVYNRFRKYMVS